MDAAERGRYLALWRYKQPRPEMTVYEFCMAIGKLGGHLNRKRDGLPGWITRWRGWMKLNDRVEAACRRCQRPKKETKMCLKLRL